MNKAQLLVFIQFFLFGILVIAFAAFPMQNTTFSMIAGLIMMFCGLSVVILAATEHSRVNQRGPNISPQPQQTAQLVQSGPYERIRHPIYTGVLLAAFGVALVHGHLAIILLAFIFIPFFTYKSMYEESLLKKQYAEYAHYMYKTGRFLPPIR